MLVAQPTLGGFAVGRITFEIFDAAAKRRQNRRPAASASGHPLATIAGNT